MTKQTKKDSPKNTVELTLEEAEALSTLLNRVNVTGIQEARVLLVLHNKLSPQSE